MTTPGYLFFLAVNSASATTHRLAPLSRGAHILSSADAQRGDFQLADLGAHSTPPPDFALIDERAAVNLRRRLRFEARRAWLWEPSEEADPGISWELIGIVQECRLWPRGEADESPPEQQREEIDRTRAGYGSATRTSAYATTNEPSARKRTSAVLRLK